MIRIALGLSGNGTLSTIESTGHAAAAGANGGSSVACAAVSALLRSVGRLLSAQRGIEIAGDASVAGYFQLEIRRISRRKRGYVLGVTDILRQGLEDIRRDYPDEIEIRELT